MIVGTVLHACTRAGAIDFLGIFLFLGFILSMTCAFPRGRTVIEYWLQCEFGNGARSTKQITWIAGPVAVGLIALVAAFFVVLGAGAELNWFEFKPALTLARTRREVQSVWPPRVDTRGGH